MIGGIFKSHPWQRVPIKIDDAASPLTAMFKSRSFEFQDETYSFFMDSWSRTNVRVLMSIDYAKMSDADKALESNASARTDGDYGLSWIRRDGFGRVFYFALGHREDGIYRSAEMLQHLLAGMQYAIGDLKADDAHAPKRSASQLISEMPSARSPRSSGASSGQTWPTSGSFFFSEADVLRSQPVLELAIDADESIGRAAGDPQQSDGRVRLGIE